jgi:hypothetical protein
MPFQVDKAIGTQAILSQGVEAQLSTKSYAELGAQGGCGLTGAWLDGEF